MGTTVRRRLGAGLLAWVGAIGVAVAVAHPSSCPEPSADAARRSVSDGVRWLALNQDGDGEFLYRYDRHASAILPGYSYARHAGTLLALEQARRAGIAFPSPAADRGIDWARAEITTLDDGRSAFGPETGATALLVATLVERRRLDGWTTNDRLLRRMGRFLEGTITDRGAVVASWDLEADRPLDQSTSPFFTGEVLWAMVRLHAEFPTEGWDAPARRISRYLVTTRDDAEPRFPPVSDHWASYAFAEMAAWPSRDGEPAGLTEGERAYARRQAGLFGLQARFESQRRDAGFVRLTRGPIALTAGIGTVGEGLGQIWRLAATANALEVDADAVAARMRCVAGMLVDRQAHGDDPRVDGAWFRLGVTQVDDQQHAISALLAALPLLKADPA